MARESIFAIVAVVLLIGVGAAALSSGYEASSTEVQVTDEQATINFSDPTTVSEGTRSLGWNETVNIETDGGTQLEDGVDYEWDAENGTVTWYDTGSTTAGDTALIDYRYRDTDEQTESLGSIFGGGYVVLSLLLLLIGGGLVSELSAGWP